MNIGDVEVLSTLSFTYFGKLEVDHDIIPFSIDSPILDFRTYLTQAHVT